MFTLTLGNFENTPNAVKHRGAECGFADVSRVVRRDLHVWEWNLEIFENCNFAQNCPERLFLNLALEMFLF